MDQFEQLVMAIISRAGEAKSLCYQALEQSRNGLSSDALESVRNAEGLLREVHQFHGGLLSNEDLPSDPRSLLLLMHAEDIFMSTMTEKELVKHMILVESDRRS